MKFYVTENNSGGRTTVLGCSLDHDERFKWVSIEAKDVDEAIKKFELHFDLDWNFQNSFEGNSCSCCGRRFTLYVPAGHEGDSSYNKYGYLEQYESEPYFTSSRGGRLEDAPIKVADNG